MSRRADLVAFIDKESKTKRNFLTPSEQKLKVLLLYLKELVLVDPKPEELLEPLLERVWFEIANTPFNYTQQPYSVFTKVFWAIAHYLRPLNRAACELLMPGVTVSGPESTDTLQEAVEPDGFFPIGQYFYTGAGQLIHVPSIFQFAAQDTNYLFAPNLADLYSFRLSEHDYPAFRNVVGKASSDYFYVLRKIHFSANNFGTQLKKFRDAVYASSYRGTGSDLVADLTVLLEPGREFLAVWRGLQGTALESFKRLTVPYYDRTITLNQLVLRILASIPDIVLTSDELHVTASWRFTACTHQMSGGLDSFLTQHQALFFQEPGFDYNVCQRKLEQALRDHKQRCDMPKDSAFQDILDRLIIFSALSLNKTAEIKNHITSFELLLTATTYAAKVGVCASFMQAMGIGEIIRLTNNKENFLQLLAAISQNDTYADANFFNVAFTRFIVNQNDLADFLNTININFETGIYVCGLRLLMDQHVTTSRVFVTVLARLSDDNKTKLINIPPIVKLKNLMLPNYEELMYFLTRLNTIPKRLEFVQAFKAEGFGSLMSFENQVVGFFCVFAASNWPQVILALNNEDIKKHFPDTDALDRVSRKISVMLNNTITGNAFSEALPNYIRTQIDARTRYGKFVIRGHGAIDSAKAVLFNFVQGKYRLKSIFTGMTPEMVAVKELQRASHRTITDLILAVHRSLIVNGIAQGIHGLDKDDTLYRRLVFMADLENKGLEDVDLSAVQSLASAASSSSDHYNGCPF